MNAIEFDREAGISLEQAEQLLSELRSRPEQLLALYESMSKSGELKRNRLVSYRCKKGCLLLDVFQTSNGPAAYRPPFKLSPKSNENTDAQARIKRTTDGQRRWVANVDLLLNPVLEYWFYCDHTHQLAYSASKVHEDIAKKRSSPILL